MDHLESNEMFDGSHPLWNPANFRLLMLLGAMFLILWWNASNFDDTEITAIIQLFMAAIGIEGVAKGLSNRGHTSKSPTRGTD